MATALPVCYHGAISRRECEELLGKKKKDGAYLIRDSETIQGALCLCVYKQKIIYTYRLLQTHTGSYTLLTAGGVQETFFKTLDDLIGHYKKKNQGLAVHLRHSVKRKTAMLIRPSRPPETRLDQRPERGSDLHGDVGADGAAQGEPTSAPHEDPLYQNTLGLSDYEEVLPD